jgi:XisI protein
MDRLDQYRGIIISTLRNIAEELESTDGVETIVLIDRDQEHYQILRIGWEADERIFDTLIHIRLRNTTVWVELNTLPIRIGEQLVAAGIPRDRIVLGFQPPALRHLTRFAA